LGKYHPFPHSKSDAEPFPVSFLRCVGNTFSVAIANVRISRFNLGSDRVTSRDSCSNPFTRRISKSPQQTEAVNVNVRDGVEKSRARLCSAHEADILLVVVLLLEVV
jgi:hypothetical protein